MAERDGDMNRVFRSSFSTWLAKDPDESEEPFTSPAKAMEYFGLSIDHDKDDRPFHPGYELLVTLALRDLAASRVWEIMSRGRRVTSGATAAGGG